MSISKCGDIGIIAGIESDLSLIDFSQWGLKCYHINDSKFKKYIRIHSQKEHFNHNWAEVYNQSQNERFSEEYRPTWDSEYLHVLAPINLNSLPEDGAIFDCLSALLVMFPSRLSIRHIHHPQIFDDCFFYFGTISTYDSFSPIHHEKPTTDFLKFDKKKKSIINKFLKLYKARVKKLKYVQKAIRFYFASYQLDDSELSFVSLCIALEGVVSDSEQLSYRFKRNLSILCGENIAFANKILSNSSKIYKLRSTIVHSGDYKMKYEDFAEYYMYTRYLVSCMIREMILHNISDNQLLNNKLTNLGLGDKKRISEGYRFLDINSQANSFINLTDLQKIKN